MLRSSRVRHFFGSATLISLLSMSIPAYAEQLTDWLDVIGVIDVRAAVSSDDWEWLDGGLGKTRYGSGSRVDGTRALLRLGEASAVFIARPTFEMKAVVHLKTDQEADFAPDIVEAFVDYAPAPSSAWSWGVKAGVFFPPVSLENNGVAWTSPYTLSNSAINAWIGEEVRTIGAEIRITHKFEDVSLTAHGAVFGFNDPAGTVLAWRGWSPHDWEAGLFDKFPLADNLWALRPGFLSAEQAPYVKPFKEIDDRVGFYAGLEAKAENWEANLLLYDNRADPLAFEAGQYGWHTRFVSSGIKARPAPGLTLIAQGMYGDTRMGYWPAPAYYAVHSTFFSGFALASYRFTDGTHQISARAERFGTNDEDGRPFDINWERGWSYTLAHDWRFARGHRVTTEALYVTSNRPDRIDAGYPDAREKELQFQLAYRYFF